MRAAALWLALALTISCTAHRQRIGGRLLDMSTGIPVAGATVLLVDREGIRVGPTAETDYAGYFTLQVQGGEVYSFKYYRFGYVETRNTGTLWVRAGDEHLVGKIRQDSTMIASTQSTATKAMAGSYFETRKLSGLGTVLTLTSADPGQYMDMATVLSGVPFARLRVDASRRKGSLDLVPPVAGQRRCRPALFLNGARLNGLAGEDTDESMKILLRIPTHAVIAVEAYPAITAIPGVYKGDEMMCGVFAVWTIPPT